MNKYGEIFIYVDKKRGRCCLNGPGDFLFLSVRRRRNIYLTSKGKGGSENIRALGKRRNSFAVADWRRIRGKARPE